MVGRMNGKGKHVPDDGIWREAPVLMGTTKFTPRSDVRNIMVTGGAGFM
jgi:dTDP-glucose 4,6-dehydratase